MPTTLSKPVLLNETGQEIVGKLDDIKEAIGTSSEFIPIAIRIVAPPTKTVYKVGERLDLSGMVVNLVGSNGVQIDVTQACTSIPANGTTLTNADTSVSITYHYAAGNIDFTSQFPIVIRELDSIEVTRPPLKTAYIVGQTLDLSGIVVTATYTDGYTANVASSCVYSPANGTVLTSSDTSLSVSYTEGSVTKTTSIPIGVKELASIAVTTVPTTVEYLSGQTLDLTGLVVTATYDDGSTLNVTENCVYNPANGDTLTTSDTSVTITYTEGENTKTTSQLIVVVDPVYGAEWDGTSSPIWTRTDLSADFTDPVPSVNNGNGSSPFDNILPWSGMERVEDTNGGTLVKIPKFYYKWTRNSAKMKLQISPIQIDGFFVSPAHADRGDGQGERDFVYVGAYHCASDYKSKTGASPINNVTRSTARTNIHNLGSDIWQWDFATYWTICMLYLVEFAHWDSQRKIGVGGSDAGSIQNSGICDAMTYHTGTNAANATTNGHTRYRYIEDLWGNVCDHVDGIYFPPSMQAYRIYCIKNPANFSDTTGGTLVGGQRGVNSGVIMTYSTPTAAGFEYALMPSGITNDTLYRSYVCDQNLGSISNAVGIRIGSPAENNFCFGLFHSYAEPSDFTAGCRLMKLPNS